jgi:hypothetical protein
MKDAKGHGSNPRGGAAHQAGVNAVGRFVPSATIITDQGTPFPVQINPSENDIRGMARESPVRITIDRNNNLYAWDQNRIVHAGVEHSLDLDSKHQDVWEMRGGRLLSQRYLPDVQTPYTSRGRTETTPADIKAAGAEVREQLDGLRKARVAR